jgi:hypothetical protein
VGTAATFAGTITIARGTGRYAHARGSGLSFSGVIEGLSSAIVVRVSGRMSV